MTQADRILRYLRLQPLCSLEPHGWEPPIHRTPARIQDLENRGHVIETERCQLHRGCGGVLYRLQTQDQGSLF